jgi:hypothetical protein
MTVAPSEPGAASAENAAGSLSLHLRRSRGAAWRRVVLPLFALTAALTWGVWSERAAILRGGADLWIVADEPAPADAVAVFGGGLEYRPFAAADYYRSGLVPKVLVSNVGSSPAERLGIFKSHVEANIEVLRKLGVPATAIETFGDAVTDSYAEAKALHQWALRSGARRILVPTDIFAARRLRWTLRRVFADDATILVPAIDTLDYQRHGWWTNEYGVIAFQNEVIKYLYYRIKY